jgi:serine/threonine protein kinase
VLFRGGRALARIVHPNVVRVLNFFRANDTVYMVMAYESGHSLQEQIARLVAKGSRAGEGVHPPGLQRRLRGLREVHANKLLHLDLKPANIYLRTDGSPMLLDFGAARQTINTDAPTLAPMYTPGFAPPELYAKGSRWGPGPTSTASAPRCSPAWPARRRSRPTSARLEDAMDPQIDKLEGAYTPELLAMVRGCLALDPLARPQSVFAVQKVLQAAPAAAGGRAAGRGRSGAGLRLARPGRPHRHSAAEQN